ncbi:MAG: hypothetical protein WC284_00575 [Candidimonas sp.]|jgi:hypothetical protein
MYSIANSIASAFNYYWGNSNDDSETSGSDVDSQEEREDGSVEESSRSHAEQVEYDRWLEAELADFVIIQREDADSGVQESSCSQSSSSSPDFIEDVPSISSSDFIEDVQSINNPRYAALFTPVPGSILNDDGVMDKLLEHVKAMDDLENFDGYGYIKEARESFLEKDNLKKTIALGEHLALALSRNGYARQDGESPLMTITVSEMLEDSSGDSLSDAEKSRLALTVTLGEDKGFQITNDLYYTRALAWYLMAQGAHLDAHAREDSMGSSMPSNGVFRMKDPGNRLYKFLNSSSDSYQRVSSHFNERSSAQLPYSMLMYNTGKPTQRGMDDRSYCLPGEGGAMLYDQLKDEEIFVKFERYGTPPIFGHGYLPDMHSVSSMVLHGIDYLNTRKATGSDDHSGEVLRQEHVYKGLLQDVVYKPIQQLLDVARESGLQDLKSKELLGSIKIHGLSAAHSVVAEVLEHAKKERELAVEKDDRAEIEKRMAAVENFGEAVARKIVEVREKLGGMPGTQGIERKGAEVLVSLDPYVQ